MTLYANDVNMLAWIPNVELKDKTLLVNGQAWQDYLNTLIWTHGNFKQGFIVKSSQGNINVGI